MTFPNQFVKIIPNSVLDESALVQGEGCIVDNIEMCEYESHIKMHENLTEIQKMYPTIAKVKNSRKIIQKLSVLIQGWFNWQVS